MRGAPVPARAPWPMRSAARIPFAGKTVGSGLFENDPHAPFDALIEGEFVHMADVEGLLHTHAEEVAAAVRADPATHRERMRQTPLDSSSGWGRWKQMWTFALLVLTPIAGGRLGFTNFVVEAIVRVLDRTHRGRNDRELLEEDALLDGMLSNVRARAKIMKRLKDYEGAPISQFRFARVMGGMTQRGFNALRWELLNRAIGANSRRRIGRGEEATSHQETPFSMSTRPGLGRWFVMVVDS